MWPVAREEDGAMETFRPSPSVPVLSPSVVRFLSWTQFGIYRFTLESS